MPVLLAHSDLVGGRPERPRPSGIRWISMTFCRKFSVRWRASEEAKAADTEWIAEDQADLRPILG
ncbi:hypothetical protein AJ87_21555 [Rhizobium yanglingense]|nr:hypothetical protein AJ87_21555 [Rhizobium yanglingense]